MNKLPLPTHIQAMFCPETYPHEVDDIEMVQTHISWVFLTGDFVYKLKKPLNLDFLDFSTLAKRKFYCEQELILNRRLSADIYLDVVALTQKGEGIELDGLGEVLDYAVKMHQFDQSGLLDQRLKDNQFDPAWMDVLARDTAAFHAEQQSRAQFGNPQMLADHIQTNFDIAAQHIGDALDAKTMFELKDFAREALENQKERLMQRQSDGFIRPCHGDLHLKNITLINHMPCIFDCIEFSDDFRIIDTMNDVAFLVMDCDAHGHPDLGFRFLSRYLEHSGDYAGLSLLNLYLFYRATVRGKVSTLLARELTDETERQLQCEEARRYFDLAARYSRSSPARLFAVGGLSGSGKSHLALQGCGVERAIIIRSDATRKRIASDYPDLDLYSFEMHGHTYQRMFADARTALEAGFSVILDATFLDSESRQQVNELAQTCGMQMHFFWLDVEKYVLEQRVKQRQSAANDISDADLRVLALQLSAYRRPDESWLEFLRANNVWPCSEK
ncbi:MAG: AAA family ATPase [Mariprofundus sp.]|nr:AAA family ATPase [Mariprofundus sp.]